MSDTNFIKKLEKQFPKVFKNYLNDGYSFVPKGWEDLVTNLCAEVNSVLLDYFEKYPEDETIEDAYPFHLDQIKEKYGGLRFYYMTNMRDEEFHKRIQTHVDMAEDASYNVCEVTGNPGTLCVKNKLYKTYCKDIREQHGFREVGHPKSD